MKVRIAKCDNYLENEDRRCGGLVVFGIDDIQARCSQCGAWCGCRVADYITFWIQIGPHSTAGSSYGCPDCSHRKDEHERPYGCARCDCSNGYWGGEDE